MVFFNYALRKLNAKIVYYGPGLCGKTTNLQWIHDHFEGGEKGKMVSLATEGDRTIFFDLLPLEIGRIRGMDVTLQLYTVPGQVHYNSTRQLVLRGADGVVFVADSQKTMRSSNEDSLRNLRENFSLQGINLPEFPHVLQFNKRDLGDLMTVEDMNVSLNRDAAPIFDAVATEGIGVQETLESIVKLVMRSLKERYESRTSGLRPPPKATVSGATGPWPATLPSTVAPTNVSAIPGGAYSSPEASAPAQPSFGSLDGGVHEPTTPAPKAPDDRGEQEPLSPEDVDTHTDIIFPSDEDSVDELEPDLAVEEVEEAAEGLAAEPDETAMSHPAETAPPPEAQGTPPEPRDESAWTMPFETVDIATLPAEGIELPEPGPVPDVDGHDEGGQTDLEDLPADQDGAQSSDDDETQTDRPRPPSGRVSGVDDLVASVLEKPAGAVESMPDSAVLPDPEETGIVQEAVSVSDEGGRAESEPSAAEPGDGEMAGAAAEDVAAPVLSEPPGPRVLVVLDDGDPFVGDEWDLPPAPEMPPAELLPMIDRDEEAAGLTSVDVAVEDNSLALKITGTGAIVESGQVRAIDIEVPVPGSWVGHQRVTLQLRLTLAPVSEDEDA